MSTERYLMALDECAECWSSVERPPWYGKLREQRILAWQAALRSLTLARQACELSNTRPSDSIIVKWKQTKTWRYRRA